MFKFGGLVQSRRNKNIGGFKFGGLKFGGPVRYRHTYIVNTEILADFNLAVVAQTAKPPNLSHRQIFRLYGTCKPLYIILSILPHVMHMTCTCHTHSMSCTYHVHVIHMSCFNQIFIWQYFIITVLAPEGILQ